MGIVSLTWHICVTRDLVRPPLLAYGQVYGKESHTQTHKLYMNAAHLGCSLGGGWLMTRAVCRYSVLDSTGLEVCLNILHPEDEQA